MKKINWSNTFFIICLLLLEFLIIDKAYSLSNNSELVSTLSIAGTLSSIILALVAIVYTFFEGVSQKTRSNTIQSQIAVLKETVQDIDTSKGEFSSELKRLDDISDKLDNTIGFVRESKNLTSELTSEIIDFKNHLKDKPQKEVKKELLTTENAHTYLETMNYIHVRCFLLGIKSLSDENKGWERDYLQLFADKLLNVFGDEQVYENEKDQKQYESILKGIYIGIMTNYLSSLQALGFIEYDQNSIDLRSTLKGYIEKLDENKGDKEDQFLNSLKEA